MPSSDSKTDEVADVEAEEDAKSDDEIEFLGPGPEKSLEMNSSAENAFSPK